MLQSLWRGTVLMALLGASGCMPARPPGGMPMPGPTLVVPTAVNPPGLPQPSGFSSAVKVGLTVYLSGMGPLDSAGQVVAPGDLRGQLRRALQNTVELVRAARGLPGDLVKLTVYLVDYRPEYEETLRQVAGEVLSFEVRPAVTVVGVAALPVSGALVAIDGVAVLRAEFPDRQRGR